MKLKLCLVIGLIILIVFYYHQKNRKNTEHFSEENSEHFSEENQNLKLINQYTLIENSLKIEKNL